MEITALKVLLKNVSCLFNLSSCENIRLELVQKYYQNIEELLKLLKPVLDVILDEEIVFDESLQKAFVGLNQYIDELRDLLENCHPLMSKVYFVLQVESLIAKARTHILDIFELLKSSAEDLPLELSSASLELCIQKIKHMGYERTSPIITNSIRDQVQGSGPSPDSLAKIADCFSLRSNQELLIEAVALEKLKENAEQAEKNGEVEYIEEMIALVTHMHDSHVMMKQSQSCNPVAIPADFCCPLSLELMTDPVIVASGQTYERAYIRKWIDLGLTVCPKTMQTLAHTNLIPNYTVKALIANWCESNNVKLPDPIKSLNLKQPSSLLAHGDSGAPRDLATHPYSRSHQPTSPNSVRAVGSPGRNLISSSGSHHGGISSMHLHSSSEDSLSGVAGDEHEMESEKISRRGSEERLADSSGQLSMSPSRTEFSSVGVSEESSQGHSRSTSAPGTLTNASLLRDFSGERNEMSAPETAYNSDVSGEVAPEPRTATTPATAHREPEFSPRFETRARNQIWRRPSERFVPRIVSSPTAETRPDLSEVEAEVCRLIEDLKSSSLEVLREATAAIRLLARHNMDNRIVIANCGAIILLIELLRSTDPVIQENAVTALLNLSINDNNKTAIANANAIEPLIHVLETGSSEAKENAAATLFSLSVIEDNKVRIGRSGAIGPLVDLLGNGTPRGKKDAATALFNLSIFHENKARVVQAGAVRYLVELMDPAAGMVDKAVAVLSNLATIHEGRAAIGQEGGIPVLVEVVELGSARGKENAAAALLQLCTNNSRFCNMVLQEGAVPPLVALSQSGTPRAKEKAQSLLSYFRNQRHGNGRG